MPLVATSDPYELSCLVYGTYGGQIAGSEYSKACPFGRQLESLVWMQIWGHVGSHMVPIEYALCNITHVVQSMKKRREGKKEKKKKNRPLRCGQSKYEFSLHCEEKEEDVKGGVSAYCAKDLVLTCQA